MSWRRAEAFTPDSPARVLLVEDDDDLSSGIELAFGSDPYVFTRCGTHREAVERLSGADFDLHLLDVNLPDGTGVDLCRRIRRRSGAPVILLTVRDRELDQVAGFEAGADDYVTKPFSLAVLRARVRAALARGPRPDRESRYRAGPFDFDFAAGRFSRDGQALSLTAGQQRLLHHLVRHAGQVVTFRSIVDAVWEDPVADQVVYASVRRLRARLGEDPADPEHLRSEYGLGYRWVVP